MTMEGRKQASCDRALEPRVAVRRPTADAPAHLRCVFAVGTMLVVAAFAIVYFVGM